MTIIRSFEDYKTVEPEKSSGKAQRVPWANEVLAQQRRQSANYGNRPSELLEWYIHQDGLRSKGLRNEIDEAEIKAAFMGVLNGWTKAVRDNPKLLEQVCKAKDQASWELILPLKVPESVKSHPDLAKWMR